MFRKMLLTTTALVVAGSMAFAAGQHGKLSHAQQVEKAKRIVRHAFEQHMPGVIFDRRNQTPVAIRLPLSGKQSGASRGNRFRGGVGFSNFSRSKNALFMSWFGWFVGKTNISYNSSYSYCLSYNSNYTVCYNHEHIHDIEQISLQQSAAQPFRHVSVASSIALAVGTYSGAGEFKVAIHRDASGLPGNRVEGASGTFSAPQCTQYFCVTIVNFPPVSLKKHKEYWVVVNGTKNTDGRLIWFGQCRNWTHYPRGEGYKYTATTKINDSYYTTRSGSTSHFQTTYNSSSGGWIHTSSFTFEEQPGAFAVTAMQTPSGDVSGD